MTPPSSLFRLFDDTGEGFITVLRFRVTIIVIKHTTKCLEISQSLYLLLIFDYFTYFNKNIELNLPKRKKIQKD